MTMEAEAAVRQFYEVLSTGNVDLLDEILADDWEDIPLPPGTRKGRENYKPVVAWLRGVFSDFTVTNEDLIVSADGTKVAVRSTNRGTHSGELFGIPATGRQVAFNVSDFHQLKDGLIVKSWHLEDFLGVVGQVGAQITPPQS